jgi:type VI secretion system secreted protein VgrG
MQTAIVTGPPGEEIHHDNFGRVKVQFHWDRQGAKNDKSSCWLRYAQGWGGGGWGMQFIPRVGDEVLIAFLDGDPDRPVIVGSLYNSANMPLYNPVDSKTVSTIRTRSYPNGGTDNFHELRFDDQKGEEEIYLRSEKDWTILVKNDKAQQVVRDESLQVGKNRLKRVGADQTELVGRNHTETIGANKNESVAINSTESVGLAKELSIGGAYQVSVGGAMNETVLGAKAEEVGVSKSVLVGAHLTEKVVGNRSMTVEEDFSTTVRQTCSLKAKSIVIEADDEIVFRSGRAQIKIDNSGNIVISGGTIQIESSGEVVIKGDRVSLN